MSHTREINILRMRSAWKVAVILVLFLVEACIQAQPERIVSLSPALTEILCQLGVRDRLVGRSAACDYPEDVKVLPAVGDFGGPDIERVLELRPDLIVSNDLIYPSVTETFRAHGVECFNMQINNTADYCACVRRLGGLLGIEAAASREIQRVQACQDMEPSGKTALVVIWEKPLIVAGEGTFPLEMLRKAGGEAPDLRGNTGYFTPSEEWLRSVKLDAVITFQKESILDYLPCKILYFADNDLLQRPGPRWPSGVLQLSQLLKNLHDSSSSEHISPANLTALRLWRIAAAFAVGAILSLAGVLFQALFRNPLATPYTLGLSSGAATGAALAFVIGSSAILPFLVPSCAFAGALLTLVAVMFASRRDRENTDSLLLCGVITGVILSSLLIYIISIADSAELAGVTWWTLGDLQCLPPYGIVTLFVLLAAGTVISRWNANALNALLLGDDTARSLGINPQRLRLTLIATASLLTAVAVSLSGIIGFVGLIIPHIARRLFTANHTRLIIPATLMGGCFLVVCDQISRLVNPIRQTPVGVITAIVGGLLFIGLLARRKF